jgi:hypothetical protein
MEAIEFRFPASSPFNSNLPKCKSVVDPGVVESAELGEDAVLTGGTVVLPTKDSSSFNSPDDLNAFESAELGTILPKGYASNTVIGNRFPRVLKLGFLPCSTSQGLPWIETQLIQLIKGHTCLIVTRAFSFLVVAMQSEVP